MNKNVRKAISYVCIFGILITSLAGCGEKSDNVVMQEKIDSELAYLDTKLVDMLNKINGISLENYIVKAEQVNQEGNTSATESSSSNSKEKSLGTNTESSEQSGTSSSSGAESSIGQSDAKEKLYKMQGNEILLQDRTTDWDSVKSEIEKLYSAWSTVILDLYKMNINNGDILNFNSDLDLATQSIKNENKEVSLANVVKLYSYIPKYSSGASNDTKRTNLYNTKYYILNAYANVEKGDFGQVKTDLSNAEQAFLPIINDIDSKTDSQSGINTVYISIKDMQKSIDNKDKDIFYIKYKNLIQEINDIR